MRTSVLAAACVLMLAGAAWGQAAPAAPANAPAAAKAPPAGAIILDTGGSWRLHHTMKPPVVAEGSTLKPVVSVGLSGVRGGPYFKQLLSMDTPGPGADWAKGEFNDESWVRGPASAMCRSPYLARLCLRGQFTVTDASKVKGLTVSVGFHGGAAVYVNGKEVARGHWTPSETVAENYPKDAFVGADGKIITLRGYEFLSEPAKLTPDLAKRIALRLRTLEAPIPASALKAGINTLAVEIVRSPYDKVMDEQKAVLDSHGKVDVDELSWFTCDLDHVQLRAAGADGLAPAAVRPAGVQVWNSDPMATDFDMDFGNPAEELRPIRLVGARNGAYSGRVVVGSDKAIGGLTATVSDLAGPGGSIPASAVRIRYALPWGSVTMTNSANADAIPYPAETTPLGLIVDGPVANFPVAAKDANAEEISPDDMWRVKKFGLGNRIIVKAPGQPTPVFGAVAPVWVTVSVPKTAAAGTYTGRLTIQIAGKKVAETPVEMKVLDWTLPDAKSFKTWVELIECTDTTAIEYNLPLWSDKHWQMMGESFRYMADVGSKVVYVPLIAETNLGNAEGMVRWIKKGEGKYEYDFSIMDKYLDLAEKNLGKPRFVVFNVWDRYLVREGALRRAQSSLKLAKDGPIVTFLGAGGKTENVMLDDYPEPGGKEPWKPLFDELHKRMAKRGLEPAMLLGMMSDFWANKEQATALKEISGGLPWINACHYYQKTFHDGLASLGYQASYFSVRHPYGKSLHGWKSNEVHAAFERIALDGMPLVRWRLIAEQSVVGSGAGIGRLGADNWLAVRGKNGARRGRPMSRYPAADWGYLNANSSALGAGPSGPAATTRYEALREGTQECEAIIYLEQATLDAALRAKLGEDLAKECEAALQERIHCLWRGYISWQSSARASLDATNWRESPSPTGNTWFVGSGWQQRSETIYRLAGEVAKKLK